MEKLEGSTPDLYIGSLISLTSKSEIRYEGLLFTLDTEKSTIVLKDVRSFGTEGRGNNILQISASNKVYEYIIFRGTDIKDLKVLSLSGAPSMPKLLTQELAHPYTVKEVGHVPVSSSTWGWPLAPPSPGMQGGMSQCYWFYSPPINEAWGVPFVAPIAIIPSFVQQKKSNCYSSSSLQGADILSPLPKNASSEQVPDSIPAKVSSPDLSEALPVDTTASSKKLLVGDTLYTQVSPERKQTQNMSNKICKLIQPSSEQPLLPLPVSESEHRRLLEESLCSASLTHSRRHKRGLRGCRRGSQMRRGDPTKLCCEEVCSSIKEFSRDFDFKQGGLCSSIKDFSRDFDFEAMNEQFNKKQVWHDLEVEAHEDGGLNGEEEESFHNSLNDKASLLRDSKKLLFIDDFFDPPSLEGDGTANKMHRTTPLVQLELDEETFGSRVSSRPRCRRRRPRKDRHGP